MKKSYLMMVAIAAMFAGCSENEEIAEVQKASPKAIGFHTFADKATRANSTALNDFYSTFNVYGWKTVNGAKISVFENVTNEFFETDTYGAKVYAGSTEKPSDEWTFAANSWYYEDIRYWDKLATNYTFSAYTPITATGDVTCSDDGKIKIGTSADPISVDNTNLMATPATELEYTGFAFDYMTATSTSTTSDVQLIFTHELAKINVKIVLDSKIKTAQDVSVNSVQLLNLKGKGYYDSSASGDGIVTNWAVSTDEATYDVTRNYSLNATTNYNGSYIMEQLMIPQTIAKSTDASKSTEQTEACAYVKYSIGSEIFEGYYALSNIFDSTKESYDFEGGKQYTLTITVGPEPIHFAASVTVWENEVNGDLPIK